MTRRTFDRRVRNEIKELIKTAKRQKRIEGECEGEFVFDDPVRGSLYKLSSEDGTELLAWFTSQGHALFERADQ